MMMPTFETNPRWKNAPKICTRANLPAFSNAKEIKAFLQSVNNLPVIEKWKCRFCGRFHLLIKPPTPAGMSSGSGREYKYNRAQFKMPPKKETEEGE